MYFKKLKITNLGPFQGTTEFDLSVGAVGNKSASPVILFGGKNGAGKTNILESVRLCLYGKQSFGRRLSESDYRREVLNRIHRNNAATEAAVEVVFSYVRNGESLDISVHRAWKRPDSDKVSEVLTIRENGSLMNSVLPDHWQEFIDDLLPPTLAQLFFFDGERIQELASDDHSHAAQALSDAVRSLFGLSMVDRLAADLAIIERDLGESSTGERAKQISEIHNFLSAERADLKAVESKLHGLTDRIERERTAQLKLEEVIRSSGGSYARKREQLESAKAVASSKLEELSEILRKESTELMPFLLCKKLLRVLKEDLQSHALAESELLASKSISERSASIREAFSPKALAKVDKSLSQDQRTKLQSYMDGLLAQLTLAKKMSGDVRAIDLSRTDISRIETFVSGVFAVAAPLARRIAVDLEVITRQLTSAQEELDKAPSEEDLRPKFEELKVLSERLGTLSSEESSTLEIQRQHLSRIRDLDFRLEKLAKEAVRNSDLGVVFERSIAAREVVKKFGVQLTKRRLESLATEVLATYNHLARKEGMIDHISIDSATFNVLLYTKVSGVLPKDRLSAGERQILAISILWAMAKLSGRAMPMIVDTPLGRLDSDHRDRLVNRYFTQASHQVIVLSTDEEVDEKFYQGLEPFIARSYHLQYDVAKGATQAVPGYFWSHNG